MHERHLPALLSPYLEVKSTPLMKIESSSRLAIVLLSQISRVFSNVNMVALAESTVTVTQTHTVTTDAFQQHATQTPAGHPSNAEFGPPPPPFDGTPYAGPSPAQPGFAFDPYMAPHQVPPPMFLPLAGGANYQPGAVMDPLTAVLSIIIVAGMYWGFKNGGVSEVMSKIVGKRVSRRTKRNTSLAHT